MPKVFNNAGTEDIYLGNPSKQAKKICPENLWEKARIKIDAVLNQTSLYEGSKIPGFHLKKLNGENQYKVELNEQYKLCFTWTDKGARDIEIVDYHLKNTPI